MENRLPGKVIYSYGLANLSFTLMVMFFTGHFALFLSDAVGITAAHAAVIMSVTHIADIFIVLLSGIIIQRTQMRWGQYRSWFILMPAVIGLFMILMYANPPMSSSIKTIWTVTAYILANLGISFLFAAHMSFISVSENATERLWLSARNTQFGVLSQIIFPLAITPAAAYFISEYGSLGYLYTALPLALFLILGYWNLFHQTGDYEKYDPEKAKPSNKMSITDLFTQILLNSQLLLLMAAGCMLHIGSLIVTLLAAYYFRFAADGNPGAPVLALALGITSIFSYLIAPYIIQKFGKKKVYLLSVGWSVICFLLIRIFGGTNPYTFIAMVCVAGFISGFRVPMGQAMCMDISEYGYYKTGKDVTAYIMSISGEAATLGVIIAVSVATFGLEIIQYDPNMPVSGGVPEGIMNMICYIPVVCGVIALVLMSFYSLTDDKVDKIMEANKLKKAEK